MIDKTTSEFRQLARGLTRRTLLYTEMIAAAAIVHGRRHALLDFAPVEKPLVLQLGTGDPAEAGEASHIAADWDYDALNLNVGCPSDRVQSGEFGACLMAEPDRVARIVEAMRERGGKPVSVKCRIGISSRVKAVDIQDFESLLRFARLMREAGAVALTVHARIAILEGLSPKENREIPPLRYGDVYRLKAELPDFPIEINGGIRGLDDVGAHLLHTDAVMLGRAALETPWFFSSVDSLFFGSPAPSSTRRQFLEYAFGLFESWAAAGRKPRSFVWPVLELFAGQRGTRAWKRALSRDLAPGESIGEYLQAALATVPAELLDAPVGGAA